MTDLLEVLHARGPAYWPPWQTRSNERMEMAIKKQMHGRTRLGTTRGFSLIEAIIAMLIIAIAAAGTLSCEFFIAKHSRQARAEMIAARTAQLLIDDWKACRGISNYDPTSSLNCGFTENAGQYFITVDRLPLYFSLNSAVIDATVNPNLKQITVTAEWRDDYSEGLSRNNSLILTTYCQ
ncbi:MAG: hypothetical protein A2Y10_09710 [Planctomycetes bacterium GWF2_41_51]|nr:MAG: hypothetical protein A2Y10_09710 [Planctomycetes bacterium GWF2_41_51]HBG28251.1 hypothetical protein [Phycisphaerales bacterium]